MCLPTRSLTLERRRTLGDGMAPESLRAVRRRDGGARATSPGSVQPRTTLARARPSPAGCGRDDRSGSPLSGSLGVYSLAAWPGVPARTGQAAQPKQP